MGIRLVVVRFHRDGHLLFGSYGTVGDEICYSQLQLRSQQALELVEEDPACACPPEPVDVYIAYNRGWHAAGEACRHCRVLRSNHRNWTDGDDEPFKEGTPEWARQWNEEIDP